LATKIRLKRIGRRNRPFYRMVAMDSRNRRDGAAIEELGWFNPIDSDHSFELKDDRILHWLGEGAQATDAAKKLLRRAGLSHRWHLMQRGVEGSELDKEMKKWELNREDVLKNRAERDDQKEKEKAKKALETATEDKEISDDNTDDTLVDVAPSSDEPSEEQLGDVDVEASDNEEKNKDEAQTDDPSEEGSEEPPDSPQEDSSTEEE